MRTQDKSKPNTAFPFRKEVQNKVSKINTDNYTIKMQLIQLKKHFNTLINYCDRKHIEIQNECLLTEVEII